MAEDKLISLISMKSNLSMLDYAALSALAAVIREGSFERAAQTLFVTPSAVSQRIRSLEERLGCALVVRGQLASRTHCTSATWNCSGPTSTCCCARCVPVDADAAIGRTRVRSKRATAASAGNLSA